jgi:hypothetical protein
MRQRHLGAVRITQQSRSVIVLDQRRLKIVEMRVRYIFVYIEREMRRDTL